jgi:predicted enzyme related to lactoylglutathione lyase
MSLPQSRFVWYELMTTDASGSADFYQTVLGWRFSAMGHYTIATAGDAAVAGMMEWPAADRRPDSPHRWMGYIGVDDVDATLQRLAAAGGAVHRPADDVPGVGRFAVVADPQHADFVLFTPQGSRAAPPAMLTPGHVGWHELHADDVMGVLPFYETLFGWIRGDAFDMGPLGTYQTFATGAPAGGGMMARQPPINRPTWLYYFNVDNITTATARVMQAGGQVVLSGPQQVPGGTWVAQCVDTQGALFALLAAE